MVFPGKHGEYPWLSLEEGKCVHACKKPLLMLIIHCIQGSYTRAIYCQPVETCVHSIWLETFENPEVAAPFKRFYDFQWGLCDYVPFGVFRRGRKISQNHGKPKMSNEKKGPWLFRVGDHTSQLCGDYFRNQCKDLYQATSTIESKRCFFGFSDPTLYHWWKKSASLGVQRSKWP